jgi:hypothetical protein
MSSSGQQTGTTLEEVFTGSKTLLLLVFWTGGTKAAIMSGLSLPGFPENPIWAEKIAFF